MPLHELKIVQLQEHFTLTTLDSIGHLKTLCMSVYRQAVVFESEWKCYSSLLGVAKNASVRVPIQLKFAQIIDMKLGNFDLKSISVALQEK